MHGVENHAFHEAASFDVRLPWKTAPVSDEVYHLQVVFANVYFHTGMVYATLRSRGGMTAVYGASEPSAGG